MICVSCDKQTVNVGSSKMNGCRDSPVIIDWVEDCGFFYESNK